MNPFDENALEAALKIKDSQPARITVLSMGLKLSPLLLRKSLAVGADELILLEDDLFDSFDSYFTASTLAAAIKKMGKYDLILCGRQAADSDAGEVGSGIAEILGIPSITVARKVEVVDGRVRVQRLVADGYEVIESPLPVLVTASNQVGDLRSADVGGLMAARRKGITVWSARELGIDLSQKRTSLVKMLVPVRKVSSQIITGDTAAEAGWKLAIKLRESHLI